MFNTTDTWKTAYPKAAAGILVMHNVQNPPNHAELDQRKETLENRLREQFAGMDRSVLANLPEIQAYDAYFKRFKKTYPVFLQLESVVLKGRSLPKVAALVEAMFMAELEDLLLTAGHDLDKLELPVQIRVAKGDEEYTLLRGDNQTLKAGDMMMSDRKGIISCIIYGPDRRTPITPETRNALFAVYAPQGIAEQSVLIHLESIQSNVKLISPGATTGLLQVYRAGG
ncbi:MAG: hypothetical protein EHM70_22320 [Chloroflexota bacterium]|nr:MAG: hypothetical protein EHM70_22320 [Chloroflexota bacterium]